MLQKRPGTAVDEIYQVLHDRIVNGKYAPGVRMSQAELAAELSTSRTPLREALNRLQANGLLVATNNRGMEVAAVRFEQTEQLYAIRLLVEPPLVAALIAALSAADIDDMETALSNMEQSRYITKAYQEAHHDFHMVMLSRYPDAMREMIESIYQKINRHQRLHFSRPQIPDDFTNTDRLFLEAIRAKNTLLARQWLEFHLIDAGLGLALDIDPDHVPAALVMAAQGIGIELDCKDGQIKRPVAIRWKSADARPMPDLETVNLKHVPNSVSKTRRKAS